jgi:hypothetical protein
MGLARPFVRIEQEVEVEIELSKWINNSFNSEMDMLNGSKLRK